MRSSGLVLVTVVAVAAFSSSATLAEDGFEMRRTASGKPDFSGFYDSGTLTPVDRPESFGDNQFMTKEEAAALTSKAAESREEANRPSDPDREAPVLGGSEVKTGGGGGTGGYNNFWLDPGSDVFEIDGKVRSVMLANQTVHTQVTTQHADVGQFLIARQGQLETALNTSGLDLGQFRVLVDRHGSGQGSQDWTPQPHDHGQGQDRQDARQFHQPEELWSWSGMGDHGRRLHLIV